MPNNNHNGTIGRFEDWPAPPAEREWDGDSNQPEPIYRLVSETITDIDRTAQIRNSQVRRMTETTRIIPDEPREEHLRIAASGASIDLPNPDAPPPERHDTSWTINGAVDTVSSNAHVSLRNTIFTPMSFSMEDTSWRETFGWAISWS